MLWGHLAHAQTVAVGPYYATPSWDQQMPCTTVSNCQRFVVLSNWIDSTFQSGGAAVLDRETGLVWERSPSATETDFVQARKACSVSRVGGRLGWRLPTVYEIASLVDPTVNFPNPNLPLGHPFSNVATDVFFWTVSQADSGLVWILNLSVTTDLLVGSTSDPSQMVRHWCVRGGQGAGAQ
jgi:hypothetical protein